MFHQLRRPTASYNTIPVIRRTLSYTAGYTVHTLTHLTMCSNDTDMHCVAGTRSETDDPVHLSVHMHAHRPVLTHTVERPCRLCESHASTCRQRAQSVATTPCATHACCKLAAGDISSTAAPSAAAQPAATTHTLHLAHAQATCELMSIAHRHGGEHGDDRTRGCRSGSPAMGRYRWMSASRK